MPGGQPTKFNETLGMAIVYLASLPDHDDKKIASKLGITERTLSNWKQKHYEFFLALKDAKMEPDSLVEKSLFERAMGYSTTEVKCFLHKGKIITKEIIRHYPPDPTSMIFWLKNRQPQKWRDKHELHMAINADNPLKIRYAVVEKRPEKLLEPLKKPE